jgi:radical SAM-linked protein
VLSENNQVKACYSKKDRPLLSEPIGVRIRFRKVGDLQYISHLDLQRTMHRILSRAGIPVWYTKGFNPHIKLVFSTPLSIGMQSECEMLDIRIEREISCEEIKALLNREVTEEMEILDVYVPDTKFSDYVWSKYEIEVGSYGLSSQIADKMNELVSRPTWMAIKTTKSGEKEFNMIPQIHSFTACYKEETKTIKISAVLNVSSESYLNPTILLDELCKVCKIDQKNEEEFGVTITRADAFREDGTTPFR